MSTSLKRLIIISNFVKQKLDYICISLIFLMTIIIWLQVILRYIFNMGLPWAEEIARYLLVWSAMIGSAVVLYENGHISVNFVFDKFSEKCKKWIKIFHFFIYICFFAIITYYGFFYSIFGLQFTSPSTGIPRFWAYLSIFVGGILMLYFSVVMLIDYIYNAFAKKD